MSESVLKPKKLNLDIHQINTKQHGLSYVNDIKYVEIITTGIKATKETPQAIENLSSQMTNYEQNLIDK